MKLDRGPSVAMRAGFSVLAYNKAEACTSLESFQKGSFLNRRVLSKEVLVKYMHTSILYLAEIRFEGK